MAQIQRVQTKSLQQGAVKITGFISSEQQSCVR